MTRSSLRNRPVIPLPTVNALQARANRQRRRARIPCVNNLAGSQTRELGNNNAGPNHIYLRSTVTVDGELKSLSSQCFAVRGLSEIISSNFCARKHIMVVDSQEASTSASTIENQSGGFSTLS
ncbi:hypothetical protein COLO4_04265, partial [Corchorus olitorius]